MPAARIELTIGHSELGQTCGLSVVPSCCYHGISGVRVAHSLAGGNGLGKSVIGDAVQFVLCGLRGAALAAAANLQLQCNRGASMSVSLHLLLPAEPTAAGSDGSCQATAENDSLQRRVSFTRRVSRTRTVVTIRDCGGADVTISEVWRLLCLDPSLNSHLRIGKRSRTCCMVGLKGVPLHTGSIPAAAGRHWAGPRCHREVVRRLAIALIRWGTYPYFLLYRLPATAACRPR